MLKKLIPVLSVLALLLAACSPAAATTAYPAPGEEAYPSPEAPLESGVGDPVTVDPEIYPAPGAPTAYDPQPDDTKLTRSEVKVAPETVQIILDAAPIVYVRFLVEVSDLCQQVRVIVNPPQDGKVNLEVYTVADSALVCAQMINQIVPTVTLGSLQPGSYEILVNGTTAGTFEVK